ncbi:hypothetical protein [Parvularcula sp. LCG005]|uniref:hypothetical protein n=1 Tax=Parvularcula sp. LCG005 TaxID=3078805 RepID=UPI0029436E06|nr:hypothetical protein [Parvularcula sp. LCG005]WOI52588.1 hypothetical protein RUI03_10560 [Parvularcula sp. LCG005]
MKIDRLYTHPDADLLKTIVDSPNLRVASPYYSEVALRVIDENTVRDMVFITRLPYEFNRPPAFIENDPAPIISLYKRIQRFTLYALPTLHAKIYINYRCAWIGSSNFSTNGFSSQEEIIAEIPQPANEIVNAFDSYIGVSRPIKLTEVQQLAHWIDAGLTKVLNAQTSQISERGSVHPPYSIEDFEVWLQEPTAPHSEIRRTILNQLHGKNQMSGHVKHAFNGVLSFFRIYPSNLSSVKCSDYENIPDRTINQLRDFIIEYGDEYRGINGGYWRNYLSSNIGGMQNGGGAGDAVVKRCLVLMPHYIDHK